MARTRAQIRSDIETFTGKSNKETLINTWCDLALKEAILRHDFELARTSSDVSGSIGDTSFSLPTGCKTIISIAVLDADGHAAPLTLKGEHWYNEHIGIPEQHGSGWPEYGCRMGTTIEFDRPLDAAYTFRVRYVAEPVFINDDTECPIPDLDLFVTYYVTALVFNSIKDIQNYQSWMQRAVGSNFHSWDGGAFAAAVECDERKPAQEVSALDIAMKETKKPTLFTDDGTAWFRD